jgi:hypothetical protein
VPAGTFSKTKLPALSVSALRLSAGNSTRAPSSKLPVPELLIVPDTMPRALPGSTAETAPAVPPVSSKTIGNTLQKRRSCPQRKPRARKT